MPIDVTASESREREDRTGLSRRTSVVAVGAVLTALSVLAFSTNGGLYLLDAADHFVNQYGISLCALVTLVVVAWLLRRLPVLRADANATSAFPLGRWWLLCLSLVTPLVLGWMLVDSLRTELDENYAGYPGTFLARSSSPGAAWPPPSWPSAATPTNRSEPVRAPPAHPRGRGRTWRRAQARPYFAAAAATVSFFTSPRRASRSSTATAIDSASTPKWRRAASRVSERPKPSVPSDVYSCGTHCAIWSGTCRIQSLTARTGPGAPSRARVT
jgi:hypothetical protein